MLSVKITGNKTLGLKNLVLDYNGTLAIDGKLISGVKEKLNELSEVLDVFVVTADTFGNSKEKLKDVKCKLKILDSGNQDIQKAEFIKKLDANACVAVGNGINDSLMLKNAGLGIALIQREGAASKTLFNSDIVIKDILDALDLLLNPKRITATLRK